MYVTAVVLAAGIGLRFKSKIPKPLAKINSTPVIINCLKVLNKHPWIKDIHLVVNAQNRKKFIAKIREYRIKKIRSIIKGGRRRQDSVSNGLKGLDARTDLVLIHDSARPFIETKTVSLLIKEAKRYGAAIVGVPVKATIKKVLAEGRNFKVSQTLDRDSLWEIQTPQVFKKDLILEAYRRYKKISVTDDASLVERLGVMPCVVEGSCFNIKITTPEDLVIARAIQSFKKILI